MGCFSMLVYITKEISDIIKKREELKDGRILFILYSDKTEEIGENYLQVASNIEFILEGTTLEFNSGKVYIKKGTKKEKLNLPAELDL